MLNEKHAKDSRSSHRVALPRPLEPKAWTEELRQARYLGVTICASSWATHQLLVIVVALSQLPSLNKLSVGVFLRSAAGLIAWISCSQQTVSHFRVASSRTLLGPLTGANARL